MTDRLSAPDPDHLAGGAAYLFLCAEFMFRTSSIQPHLLHLQANTMAGSPLGSGENTDAAGLGTSINSTAPPSAHFGHAATASM